MSDTTERLPFHFSLSCIGEGNCSPLECSCLENPRVGEAWWAAVYGVAQSRTRLKRLSSSLYCGSFTCWFRDRNYNFSLYNSLINMPHTLQSFHFITLSCTIELFLLYSQSCATFIIIKLEYFHHLKKKPCNPWLSILCFQFSDPQIVTNLLSVSIYLPKKFLILITSFFDDLFWVGLCIDILMLLDSPEGGSIGSQYTAAGKK